MFNPFATLSQPLLDAFIKAGKKHFVRQTFSRAMDHFEGHIKGCFFITHYGEASRAQHHFRKISHEQYKFLYDWNEPEHQKKLFLAADNPNDYKIYSCVIAPDWQKHVTGPLKLKAKHYIDFKLGWKPGRGQSVNIDLYVDCGEVYAKITLKTREVRVKLEDIESMR